MGSYTILNCNFSRSGLIESITALDDGITLDEHYNNLIKDQQNNYQKR